MEYDQIIEILEERKRAIESQIAETKARRDQRWGQHLDLPTGNVNGEFTSRFNPVRPEVLQQRRAILRVLANESPMSLSIICRLTGIPVRIAMRRLSWLRELNLVESGHRQWLITTAGRERISNHYHTGEIR